MKMEAIKVNPFYRDWETESSGTKNTESDTKTQSETTSGNAKRVIRKVKGRSKLRKAAGRNTHPVIRRLPNGVTRLG